ncbi:hypothetical protein HKX48_009490 [Thoreauomyces humboldtii]|nr:hypothetical protein HKX48_009490 [Thoreauomyces humboldtii]
MAAPPLPEELGVTISSFHMLCERLSNLEISLDVLTEAARTEQQVRFGSLNQKLLGYRFPILRRPSADLDASTHTPNAPLHPQCLIVCIAYRCDGHGREDCCGSDLDVPYFSSSEVARFQSVDLSQHPTPKMVGIPSVEGCLCDEAGRRQLQGSFDKRLFDECYLLPWSTESECTIFLRACRDGRGRVSVTDFIDEALRFFVTRHDLACVDEVIVEDSDIWLIRLHELGMEWCASEEERRREIALHAKATHMEFHRKRAQKHLHFSMYLGSYSGMFA